MTINFGIFYLGQANPYFQAIYDARVAAFAVWNIISEVQRLFSFLSTSDVLFSSPSSHQRSIKIPKAVSLKMILLVTFVFPMFIFPIHHGLIFLF